jgi:hypothetical protein
MFKDSHTARTYLRVGIATALAMAGAASTIWVDNPLLIIATAGLTVLAGYLGIGALTISEPFYGKVAKGVQVPPPPESIPDPEEVAEQREELREYVHPRYKP